MSENQESYCTILKPSEGLYKEKGSKFTAFAFPVETEEEIKEKRELIRKQYHDARHWVYAFRLGAEGESAKASDDGEPAHSSGPPVLGKIRSHHLTDILIVVVRYFGGTKLGIPGLIRAYGTAAEEAINKAQIIKRIKKKTIELQFPYEEMNNIMRLIKEENLEIISQGSSHTDCVLQVAIEETGLEKITGILSQYQYQKINISFEED